MAKLKRVVATVKRQERRERREAGPNFAAIQLLHDPQVCRARWAHAPGLGFWDFRV